MCGSLRFNEVPASVGSEFRPADRLLIQRDPMTLDGVTTNKVVYWDGWAREEELHSWLSRGPWQSGELLASSFNEKGRDFEVPPGHSIRILAMETKERVVMKIVTREAVGKEKEVHGRFAKTGPRRLIPKKP